MRQKIGTDQFFRRVDPEHIPPNVICADCAYDDCDNCKFPKICDHIHYYDMWGSVASIQEANPDLNWNSNHGMWEGSTEALWKIFNLPSTSYSST